MIDTAMKAPVWVARPFDLDRMIQALSKEMILAVDTEANSLHAYREQVCLIQFSTDDTDYLVDPLSLADLSALNPIFENPAIEKVFHAAEYDIIGMKRDFGFAFAGLFDTMMACRILGRAAVGLAAVLEEEFGIVLDKRYQRANWGQRPLPTAMLNYARLDTHYLVALRARLYEALQESGRWPLAQEDFYRLTFTAAGNHNEIDAQSCWRLVGNHVLTPQQNAVLFELCAYRDRQAEAADLPLFKVLPNAALLQIAEVLPEKLDELYSIEGISPRLVERHGRSLLAAVQRGLHAPPLERPIHERPDEAYMIRLEALRNWRKLRAREWEVESDVILPRDVLEEIAHLNPRTLADLARPMRDLPWRHEHFGQDILNVIHRG